jgi:predicted methyltransferase
MSPCRRLALLVVLSPAVLLAVRPAAGQEKSVRPGINKPFEDPDVAKFVKTFEVESREIYARRKDILAACKLRPGMAVADVGAGTGLFTRLFAQEVGPDGKVYAVDIAPRFLDHIRKTCREAGLKNVEPVLCDQTSANLPANSIDLAFICDTYHHFEFPYRTMASLYRALRPGGQVVLIDFHRIPGKSRLWVLGHVRAGQEVVRKEIETSGFRVVEERQNLLGENYFLRFEKVETPARNSRPAARPRQDGR